ncbi:MAG: IgGFc-binding protein, partial [Verrucomicrobiales bacterium]
FALWGRALSASAVTSLYDAGNQGLSFKDPASGAGGSPYDPLITSDVELEMKGVNSSAYVRVPFYLSAFPGSANKMLLRMRYDDGFQAYLNGVPVASRRIPSSLTWNSKATSDRFDPLGLVRETIDISSHIGALQQGTNVLAIHGLNADAKADRFLILPELCVELRPPGGGGQDDLCVKTTNGREFWLAFPENFEEEPGYPPEPSVCITGQRGTSFTVDMPKLGIAGYPKSFVIPSGKGPMGCVVVHLPKDVELEGADDIESKAVVVKASADVSVYGQNRIDYSTDSYLGLPLSCLGTEYMVLTYKNVQTNVPLIQGTQLAIVAPYDATQVTVTLRDGTVLNVSLNSSETYQFRNNDPSPVDVTGARVKANKPISVYGSHRCANIQSATQFFCDFLVEQLFPLAGWGRNYRIAPLETRSGDTLRILAAFDNTPVNIDEVGVAPFI